MRAAIIACMASLHHECETRAHHTAAMAWITKKRLTPSTMIRVGREDTFRCTSNTSQKISGDENDKMRTIE